MLLFANLYCWFIVIPHKLGSPGFTVRVPVSLSVLYVPVASNFPIHIPDNSPNPPPYVALLVNAGCTNHFVVPAPSSSGLVVISPLSPFRNLLLVFINATSIVPPAPLSFVSVYVIVLSCSISTLEFIYKIK